MVETLNGAAILLEDLLENEKFTMVSKAHGAIILCLGDNALREVSKEKTANQLWKKLEQLYIRKSLQNMLFLKYKLFSFKLVEDKAIFEQVDEFNKIVDDLKILMWS